MPYVNVDIDLDEIETYELVEELVKRFKTHRKKDQLTEKQKEELREEINELLVVLKISPVADIAIKSLDDKIKYDHIASVWYKYTSCQIEKMLP